MTMGGSVMALLKLARVACGLAVFPFLAWTIVSLFRGDFGGLFLGLLGAFIGFVAWALCHQTLARNEASMAKRHKDEAMRAIRAGDWSAAASASQAAVVTLRSAYTRDRGQPEFAVPYGLCLFIYAVTLGSIGQLDAARTAFSMAEQLLGSNLANNPELFEILSIVDDLQGSDAGVAAFRDCARDLSLG